MLASINSQKNIVPDRQQAGGFRYDGWLPVGLVHPKKNAEVAHNIAHAAWRHSLFNAVPPCPTQASTSMQGTLTWFRLEEAMLCSTRHQHSGGPPKPRRETWNLPSAVGPGDLCNYKMLFCPIRQVVASNTMYF